MQLNSAQRLPPAPDLSRALEESRLIADGVGQKVSTTHVLLALFTVPNPAEVVLRDKHIDEDTLIDLLRPGAKERGGAVPRVLRAAEETAVRCDAKEINTLHLLIGLLRAKETIGQSLLTRAIDDVNGFRNQVMAYLTGTLPRRLHTPLEKARATARQKRDRTARRRPHQTAPSDDWVVPRETLIDGPMSVSVSGPVPSAVESSTPVADPLADDADPEPPGEADAEDDGRFVPAPISRAPTLLPTAYDLDPDKFPWLTSLGRNLSSLAEYELLDPAVGRAREIQQIVDVLGKRRANNPCLVGEPGVGKTAIAEGLAIKLVRGDEDVRSLLGKVIIELDMGRITAGTSLRGSFSERMQGLKKDVERAKGRVIVFIDEIHTIMGAGSSGESPQDAANELKAALSRGAFPVIGSTTIDEYKKFIEQDPALERRFVRLPIEEPDDAEAIEILRGAAPLYERHHRLRVDDDGICAAVQLSSRFVHDRKLPGKAIDLLDLAMSRARRAGAGRAGREEVARVCADVAKVPLERVLLDDAERFLEMESALQERVVGHTAIIAEIADTLRRNYAGFETHRPLGSFLFLGPSGVGKTELAKALAEFLFGDTRALVRLDMSEFSESHAVAKLVGAPPGYVGHTDGGQLTDAMRRRPHAVVLLDEIEKAHPDVLPLLLQILDEGRLTDAKGRTATFRHAAVILTSNLGAARMVAQKPRVGFHAKPAPADPNAALSAAQSHFPPELWGRIGAKLVFAPLQQKELVQIARLLLDNAARALKTTRNIEIEFDTDVLLTIVDDAGCDDKTGARPLRMSIQKLVEAPLAEAILKKDVREGSRVTLSATGGKLRHRTTVRP